MTDDPTARIAALFDAHCGFVCRVLRHHGVHEAALDDAVQDVFVTAHRRWSSFEGRSSARSWLYGIARRIAFRYRRSADARARRFVAEGEAEAGAEGVDEPFARAHAAQSLAALLQGLDDDKRTVFVLAELEGMTAPEVAEALGIPLGTAYSRLRAAWQVLGQQAGREHQRLQRALPSMRAPDPSPERRQRMWGLVIGGLRRPAEGGGAAAAGSGWLVQIKWLAVGAALGVGLLGARAATVASSRADAAPPVRGAAEPAKGNRGAGAPGREAVPVEREASTVEASAGVVRSREAGELAAPASASAASPAAPSRPRGPSPAAASPAAQPVGPAATASADPSTAAGASPGEGTLAAELALLQRARVALRDGRPDDALALLDQHARQYPAGQLVDERRVLAAEAGRSPEARTAP